MIKSKVSVKSMKKTVIVTGASKGIGRAIAIKFAKEGWQVVINFNNSEKEADLLEKELSLVTEVIKVKADISKKEDAKFLISEAIKRFGKIDALVNNAGIAMKGALFTDTERCDWEKIFNTNLFGMFNVTKAALSYMIHEKSGAIVNVSSIWGISGASCEVLYSSSKAAVNGFTKALSKELAPSGIRVNAVAPGVIETKMNAFLSDEERKALEDEIPMGRYGDADEIASAIYFLSCEESSYITGQILTADGGFLDI